MWVGKFAFGRLCVMAAVLAAGFSLAGCVTDTAAVHRSSEDTLAWNGAASRRLVAWNGKERPGTIVISTSERTLTLVQRDKTALQYDVGVGRRGFEWSGSKHISAKRIWPAWTPPPQMHARQKGLPRYMTGGIENPLGARAMYLGSSLYRIHGSNDPQTIGQAVSSGCFRMNNSDVMDLFERVKVGTSVIIRI